MSVTDLTTHRREAALAELRGILRSDPVLHSRYDAATAGELPAPEVLMAAEETTLSLRLPRALLDRADQLVDPMTEDVDLATVTGGRITRSTV